MITIQTAEITDVKDIITVHNASVYYYGKGYYPEEILKLWSPPATEKRIRSLEGAVSNPNEYVILAKKGNRTAGVGILIIPACKIGMVYVHPDFGGKGVGTGILKNLEEKARKENIANLTLDSSLNAEKFYCKNGFVALDYGAHDLASGHNMECVRMEKLFPEQLRHSV